MDATGGDFFVLIKRLLLHESWESAAPAGALLCQLLDDSVVSQHSDDEQRHSRRRNKRSIEKGDVFFSFVRYFASALTSRRSSGVHDSVNFTTVDKLTSGNACKNNNSGEQESDSYVVLFPSIHELWGQPSLVAAMERLAKTLWTIQEVMHSDSNEKDSNRYALELCPLCYAASIEHVVGTDALWTLLEFYVVHHFPPETHGVSRDPYHPHSNNKNKNKNTHTILLTNNESEVTIGDLHTSARFLLWRHAMAVCRNAVWNGAIRTARLCVEEWVYKGTHPALFTVFEKEDKCMAVRIGNDVFTFRAFLLIQLCLLIQDEVAFEMDTKRKKRNNSENYDGDDSDPDAHSSVSPSTLLGRDDICLHASLLTLYEMSNTLNCDCVLATLTTTTPHHATGGVPLLHWVCKMGYENSARLLLTAWVTAYYEKRLSQEGTPLESTTTTTTMARAGHEEKRLRIHFSEQCGKEKEEGRDVSCDVKERPKRLSRAIRCTALTLGAGVLPYAMVGKNVAIVRHLLLLGASRHQSKSRGPASHAGEKEEKEMEELMKLIHDPAAVVDKAGGTLHERIRHAICATAAADELASLAWRLWNEKVRALERNKCNKNTNEEVKYRRAHDTVMRTALAALEFDPRNTVARTTLRDVLIRKAMEYGTAESTADMEINTPGRETALQQKRYNIVLRRMCEQLLSTRTEREREVLSVLRAQSRNAAIPSSSRYSPIPTIPTIPSATINTGTINNGGSTATIAVDELRMPVYALVNIIDTTDASAAAIPKTGPTGESMMHPLWVRLPHGVDVPRSLELAGGLCGVVEGVVPLTAPVERGDLVIFTLRRNLCRFDATRIVRPCEGVVVELPCVLQNKSGCWRSGSSRNKGELVTCVLRCAMVPAPVYEFDDDRIASDPLQWLDTKATPTTDVVESIRDSRHYLQRWWHIVEFGKCPAWFRDISIHTHEESVWQLPSVCISNRVHTRGDSNCGSLMESGVLAVAAFPFACGVDRDEADDPFGASSEAIFLLQSLETETSDDENNGVYGVKGVFPFWGWD